MAGYVILGALGAFGALCILWCLAGFLLPGTKGWVLVRWGDGEEDIFWRLKWLRSLGLLNCPMLVVGDPEAAAQSEAEICSPEDLLPRLIEERNRFNGTGNGDHPGRHQRRGVSEL